MDIHDKIYKLAERPTVYDMLESLWRADELERKHQFVSARIDIAGAIAFLMADV